MCLVIKDCDGSPCEVMEPCTNHETEITEPDPDQVQIENTEALCSDKLDNDHNGYADCYDENCKSLQYCIDWLADQTLEKQCKDELDNDDDFEIDCDDADCSKFDFCSDENDPDWDVEGTSCKASEIGMIPDKSDDDTRKNNFKALNGFVNGECSKLIVDGDYYLRPYQDGYQSTKKYIDVNRVIKIIGDEEKGGHLHFANNENEICGFAPKPGGGIIMENMKLSSPFQSSGNAIIDAHEYVRKFHGTAERLMFRNCEFDLAQLIRINGVHNHYDDSTYKHYDNGNPIKKRRNTRILNKI